MKILITGGAGFIGGNHVHYAIEKYPEDTVICVDKLTYAGNMETLASVLGKANFFFEKADIADRDAIFGIFEKYKPDCVINYAAESHVDRSIEDPGLFLKTNITGTQVLLDASREFGVSRYHQVSTDEVYGDLPLDRPDLFFTEETPIHASSPYSASKAGADLLCLAYARTYKMPITISRCSNNYGPYHFPEKLIPLMILNAMQDKPLPVYGKGENVRDWLYVLDHCRAVDLIVRNGIPGEIYNIGGHNERTNIDVVKEILKQLDKPESLIQYVADRPGHDLRYAIDPTKIHKELGWLPETKFEDGLRMTIEWYKENRAWWEHILGGEYREYYSKMYDGREIKAMDSFIEAQSTWDFSESSTGDTEAEGEVNAVENGIGDVAKGEADAGEASNGEETAAPVENGHTEQQIKLSPAPAAPRYAAKLKITPPAPRYASKLIVVTGAAGQLGTDVVRELEMRETPYIGIDIADLDITDSDAVSAFFKDIRAQQATDAAQELCVIHCAAYTTVDKAEDEQELCFRINAKGSENIAKACNELDAEMIYISTDYVFGGEGETPYEPDAQKDPKSAYGRSKLAGEDAVKANLDKYYIVRTSWVYGHAGNNFVQTMLRLSETYNKRKVVGDQTGSPTFTRDLAVLLCDMAFSGEFGEYHATNEGFCTWAEFAREIMKQAGRDTEIISIPTEEYPTKAVRPKNSRLSKKCLDDAGFERLPPWQDALKRYLFNRDL